MASDGTTKGDLDRNYAGVFDGKLGFGQRPSLILVDFIAAYSTPGSPLFMENTAAAVAATKVLLEAARKKGIPVVYTRVIYNANGSDGGLFVKKVPSLRRMTEQEPLARIIDDIAPSSSDTLITKQYASAFFGTALAGMLTANGVDTAIITGVSTSGCVRATALDAMQHGFRPIIPRECVADRHPGPHEANLFDINAKYGDVISAREALDFLEHL